MSRPSSMPHYLTNSTTELGLLVQGPHSPLSSLPSPLSSLLSPLSSLLRPRCRSCQLSSPLVTSNARVTRTSLRPRPCRFPSHLSPVIRAQRACPSEHSPRSLQLKLRENRQPHGANNPHQRMRTQRGDKGKLISLHMLHTPCPTQPGRSHSQHITSNSATFTFS